MWTVTTYFQEECLSHRLEVEERMKLFGLCGVDNAPHKHSPAGHLTQVWVIVPDRQLDELTEELKKRILAGEYYLFSIKLWFREPEYKLPKQLGLCKHCGEPLYEGDAGRTMPYITHNQCYDAYLEERERK